MPDFIINDSNYHNLLSDPITSGMCGCLPRRTAYGALPFARAQQVDLIPWEQIPDMIADQERNKSGLYHIWEDAGAWTLDQNPLSYCWAGSVADAIMFERAVMGLPFVKISLSSIAAPVVQFKNTGYYVEAALKEAIDVGGASVEFVPEATTDPRSFKPGWRDNAAKNRVVLWTDCTPRNPQEMLTRLLRRQPVAVGLNWWGHAVCFARPMDRYPKMPANDWRRYGIGFLNTWGSWGDRGWGILEGDRQLADQAYAVLQASFV